MSGWKSLVVGVDFTPCSAAALRQAIRIAERTRAALQAVHVIETLVVMDLEEALSPFQADVRAGLVRDARDAWPEFTADIPGASALELEVEIDNPVAAILRRVRERSEATNVPLTGECCRWRWSHGVVNLVGSCRALRRGRRRCRQRLADDRGCA